MRIGPLPRATRILVALIGVVCFACTSDKGEPASRAERSSTVARTPSDLAPVPEAIPDVRSAYRLRHSLLREVSRAEIRYGETRIDFGTSDQHKYTRGGWASGWSLADDAEVSAARSATGEAILNLYLLAAPKELVVRARSPQGSQALRLSAGGQKLEQVQLTSEWQEHRIALPKLGIGRKRLKLEHDKSKPIDVDWLWLDTKVGRSAPLVADPTGPVRMNKSLRRALLAKGLPSYSYYLPVSEATTLIFDYGSASPMDFVVRAQDLSGPATEIFRATGEADWKTAEVDLSAFAGKMLRLELATEAHVDGTELDGAWGEPGIFEAKVKNSYRSTIAKAPKAKNLILVVLDTTRADQFETFTPDNGIHTPNLDAFAKESTAFTRAYNNGNWTKPSVLSIFSSLYPATHTATKPESMVPEGVGLISEHLQKQGLRTQGFSSNPVVSEKFGFERGWDDFKVFYTKEARGEAMYKRAATWVEENSDKPFFLYVQTIDPHTTYAVSKDYWGRYYDKNYNGPIGQTFTREDQSKINDRKLVPSKNDVAWIQALYHGEITYQDEHVGGFLQALREQGRLEDTVVVVTNDHGEEIYDHGSFGHGWTLYEEMIRAPLLIHYPPLFPVGEVERITEHVDLAPTLVQALGLPPMKGIEGRSFLPSLHGAVERLPTYAISLSDNGKRSIHIGDWKLEVAEKKGWKHLYEITSEAGESRDRRKDAELAGRFCEIYMAEGMANPRKLERLKGMGGESRFKAQDANMDAETRKQMEALGYL